MERNEQEKSECYKCKKKFEFHEFIGHECREQSNQTFSVSVLPSVNINDSDKDKDLLCTFCNIPMQTPFLLEIHMRSCRYRNTPQICKRCKSPIRLRNHVKQYCSNCSTIEEENRESDLRTSEDENQECDEEENQECDLRTSEEENRECDLRFKTSNLNEALTNKCSKSCIAQEKKIGNCDFDAVNCVDSSNSFTRKRITPLSDSQKRDVSLKLKVARNQGKEKRTPYAKPKITANRVENMENQTQNGMGRYYKLRHPSSKVLQNSGRNTVQQKKDFEGENAEVSSEKFKNKHSRKSNFNTIRQIDEQKKPPPKKSNQLPSKNNPTNKTIKLKLLCDLIPGSDGGLLLQLPSANKIDHLYKCCKCGREFKTVKLVSVHYSSCKSAKFLNSEVPLSEVKWVCLICLSLFSENQILSKHLRNCNIYQKNYDGACELWCKKCNFKCMSPFYFDNHDCEQELKKMKTCSVRLNMIKMNVSQDKVLMSECKFCDEIFDVQYADLHFEACHPGVSRAGNVRKFLVNIHSDPNLQSSSDSNTVVIKTEPHSPDPESGENASSSFNNPKSCLNVNSHPPCNPVLDNISMPPPSVSLSTNQSPSTQAHEPSCTGQEGINLINQQICKCPNRNEATDAKLCLKCLSKVDISRMTQNFRIVPFGLAKIKRENSEESEESNHNTQANFNTPTSSTQNGGQVIEMGGRGILDLINYTSLTPPSSHNGISPPSTPGALVQSLTNIEPCSASDVSIGSLNDDISMVHDIAQLDEPRCPDELVHYINDDCSPDIPLIPCDDDQGLFTPMESYKILHLWDVEDLGSVDAWAMVPSEGSEAVEKYICSECISFSCLDRNSILKHWIEFHEKKLQFLAMYIVKTENDSL